MELPGERLGKGMKDQGGQRRVTNGRASSVVTQGDWLRRTISMVHAAAHGRCDDVGRKSGCDAKHIAERGRGGDLYNKERVRRSCATHEASKVINPVIHRTSRSDEIGQLPPAHNRQLRLRVNPSVASDSNRDIKAPKVSEYL